MPDWIFKLLVWLSAILKPDDWGSFFWRVAAVVIFCFAAVIAFCLIFVICGIILWEPPLLEEEEFANEPFAGDGSPVHA
jgi:hypothetical protein